MILFLDTESTGLVVKGESSHNNSQPDLVEIACILCENNGMKRHSLDMIVRPEGRFVIPPESEAIHGLSTEVCERVGLPLELVMLAFVPLFKLCDRVVAHNWYHDRKIIKTALFRARMESTLVDQREKFCTMKEGAAAMGGRWPKLGMLYKHFLGREISNAHTAMADCMAVREIYKMMNPEAPEPAAGQSRTDPDTSGFVRSDPASVAGYGDAKPSAAEAAARPGLAPAPIDPNDPFAGLDGAL